MRRVRGGHWFEAVRRGVRHGVWRGVCLGIGVSERLCVGARASERLCVGAREREARKGESEKERNVPVGPTRVSDLMQ